jgi:predicted patatin/cPLA2 family phospholipase
MSKVCLVLEGGGNRGIYTTGVLDAFLENDIFINNIYGVSAGALNAMSYLSKQKGRSYRVNKEYIFKNCINYKRFLQGKSILNLDYLFNEVNLELDKLDIEAMEANMGEYIVTCLDMKTGRPVYKKIESYQDYPYIQASASLPLFTTSMKLDGTKLLDGGFCDPIPVMKAIDDGYDKVIVICTRHKEFEAKPYSLMNLYKIKYRRYPEMLATFKNRYNKYNITRDIIEDLANKGKVFAIYPSEELHIAQLEKDMSVIEYVYKVGYQDGLNIIKELNKFLGGRVNEKKGR